jgi:hypothetical protein
LNTSYTKARQFNQENNHLENWSDFRCSQGACQAENYFATANSGAGKWLIPLVSVGKQSMADVDMMQS